MFPPTTLQKYQLYRVGSFISLLAALFFITHMSPWATPHYNKVRFAWLMSAIIVGLWCSIATIYYRSKIRNPDVSPAVVNTLAAAGSQLKQTPNELTPPADSEEHSR